MLPRNEENLTKARSRQVPCLGDGLLDIQSDAENWVVPGKSAVSAVVDAFVGKVNRREETHRPPEILHGEGARSLRHGFQLLVGLQSDQALEPADELRFPEGQIVQGLNERHH